MNDKMKETIDKVFENIIGMNEIEFEKALDEARKDPLYDLLLKAFEGKDASKN